MKLIKKKMEISWYIKLNIMVLGFLFVLFLMKQLNTSSFRTGLDSVFTTSSPKLSVRIKVEPPKNKGEKESNR